MLGSTVENETHAGSSDVPAPTEKNTTADPEDKVTPFMSTLKQWLTVEAEAPEDVVNFVDSLDTSDKDSQESLKALQKVINGYNLELENMFDNYVCFHGEKDKTQMERFLNAALVREKKNWGTCNGSNNQGKQTAASIPLLEVEKYHEQICQCIREKFIKQNELITEYEDKIASKVREKLVKEAAIQLENVGALKVNDHAMSLFGQRIIKEGCRIMTTSLNFGGRLNNVTGSHMTSFCKSLNEKLASIQKENIISNEIRSETAHTKPDNGNIFIQYVTNVQKNLFHYSPTNWEIFHNTIFNEICSNKETLDKDTETRLMTYLVFVSELKQKAQMGSTTENITPSQIIYITDTDELLKVAINQEHNWMPVTIRGSESKSRDPDFSTAASSRIKVKFSFLNKKEKLVEKYWHGKIFNCIMEKPRTEVAEEILQTFFRDLIDDVSTTTNSLGGTGASMIIVPSWFSPRNHAFLRRSAKSAGISNSVFVLESSLVAYQLLQGLPHNDHLVCVVMARHDAVRVEIFEKNQFTPQNQSISLAAMAYGEWTKNENYKKYGTFSKSSVSPLEFFKPTLISTLSSAINQLPTTACKQRFSCLVYVITDDPTWKPYLTTLLDKCFPPSRSIKNTKLIGEEEGECFAMEGAKKLIANGVCSNIETILLDFAIPKTPTIMETTLPEKWRTHYRSNLSQAQENLIEKCNNVEMKVCNECLSDRVLSKKLLLKAVQAARVAVQSRGNVEKAENDIDELLKDIN